VTVTLYWIGFSGVTKARVCRPTGSLSQWTVAGDSGLLGETVHVLVAAALKPVYASVIVPGSYSVFTITDVFCPRQMKDVC